MKYRFRRISIVSCLLLSGCLDYDTAPDPSPSTPASATGSIAYGGQTYATVTIGSQTWMAQNLNYSGQSGNIGKCYGGSTANCATYGRLYTWAEVMNLSSAYNTSPWNGSDAGHQGICPSGWHVPSYAEWSALVAAEGGVYHAGIRLKSTSGWYSGNGVDACLFRALPGGLWDADEGYSSLGTYAGWWSASETGAHDVAWIHGLNSGNFVNPYSYAKTLALSVRCIRD